MEDIIGTGDIPMGLGMALAENMTAMEYFAGLTDDKRRQIIEHTRDIKSKSEMRRYVRDISKMY
ncbi:MAG: hypothetical protein IJP23_03435 [Oscillospiraceae bacterium]|nr:hypothetical protein [Oscillospiraceae bacterium]